MQKEYSRPPLASRALRNEASRLRADAAELESLLGGGDSVLCHLAASMRRRADAADRLARVLQVKARVAA